MARSSSPDGAFIDPEVRSFFRAIKENPDDDTPRLIFADWLQERGDAAMSARGEFLRLNVLRHRLSPDDPDYDKLKRREAEIVRQYQWTWLRPLADAARWTYERGMIRLVTRATKTLTTEIYVWTQTEEALWIDALTLTHAVREDAWWLQIVLLPLLEHPNRLDLSENNLGDRFDPFLEAHHFPFLRELLLARNRLTAEHIASLVEHPLSRRLMLLDLRHNRLNDDAARLLSESVHLRNIGTLRAGGNRFTPEGRALLRDAFGERVQY
jgi:uncharacterized protein (TIGR02996 family)